MDALISARAGTALLIHGSDLASIHADSPDKAIPRRAEEAHLLFGEAQDLQVLEGVDRDQVVRHLMHEVNSAEALQLSLILLDSELPGEIRSEAAEELDGLLAEKECREGLERVLFAHPLPREADLLGTLACSEQAPRTQDLLSYLAELQPSINEVHRAWIALPDSLFESFADRQRFQAALVRQGQFQDLVQKIQGSRLGVQALTERFRCYIGHEQDVKLTENVGLPSRERRRRGPAKAFPPLWMKPIVSLASWFRNLISPQSKSAQAPLGRNDACWCGSGKKYTKCHLKSDELKRIEMSYSSQETARNRMSDGVMSGKTKSLKLGKEPEPAAKR